MWPKTETGGGRKGSAKEVREIQFGWSGKLFKRSWPMSWVLKDGHEIHLRRKTH